MSCTHSPARTRFRIRTVVPHSDVLKVSAALQKQATRDLGPIWEVSATVDAFEKLEDVPVGYWPMRVMDDIQVDGAAGIHEDENGQPFALITASSDLNTWSLTASHEAFEMLVDPFGNRVIAGDSPKPDQGRASFLVEVCDPSEAERICEHPERSLGQNNLEYNSPTPKYH